MIKACIFDLDGTLLNTIHTIAYYGNMALTEYNVEPYEDDAYKYMVGNGAKILVERMLAGKNKADDSELFDKVYNLYNNEYNKNVEYRTQVYDGIFDVLNELKVMGIKTAVLSNKPDYAAQKAVKVFMDGYFDVVHGQRENIKIKPSPEGVFEILRELNISQDEILYIGDTATDMKTGKSSGAYTIGVLWGFRDRAELERENPDAIIDNPQSILDIINKLNG